MLKSAVILLTLALLLSMLSVSAGPVPMLSLNKRQEIPPQDDTPMTTEGDVDTDTLPEDEEGDVSDDDWAQPEQDGDDDDQDWGLQDDAADPDMQDAFVETMPATNGESNSDQSSLAEVTPGEASVAATEDPAASSESPNPDVATPTTDETSAATGATVTEEAAPAPDVPATNQKDGSATTTDSAATTIDGSSTTDGAATTTDGSSTTDGAAATTDGTTSGDASDNSSSADIGLVDMPDSLNGTQSDSGAQVPAETPAIEDPAQPPFDEEFVVPTPTPETTEGASPATEGILPTSTESPSDEVTATEQWTSDILATPTISPSIILEDAPTATTTSAGSEEASAIPYPGPMETGSSGEDPATNVQSFVDDGTVPVVIAANTDSANADSANTDSANTVSQDSTAKPPTAVEGSSSNAAGVVMGLMGVLAVVGLVSFLFVSKAGRRARTWIKQRLPEAGYRRTTDLEMTMWN